MDHCTDARPDRTARPGEHRIPTAPAPRCCDFLEGRLHGIDVVDREAIELLTHALRTKSAWPALNWFATFELHLDNGLRVGKRPSDFQAPVPVGSLGMFDWLDWQAASVVVSAVFSIGSLAVAYAAKRSSDASGRELERQAEALAELADVARARDERDLADRAAAARPLPSTVSIHLAGRYRNLLRAQIFNEGPQRVTLTEVTVSSGRADNTGLPVHLDPRQDFTVDLPDLTGFGTKWPVSVEAVWDDPVAGADQRVTRHFSRP